MDPTEILPPELWFHINNYLESSTMLTLWKVNTYFHDTLTSKLRLLRRTSYGIDLINDVKHQTSILSTYRLIDGPNNLLLPGIYHLHFDVMCDIPPEDHLFLISGEVRFVPHGHKFFLRRGSLFGMQDCVFRCTRLNLISLISMQTTLLASDTAEPSGDNVYMFHAITGISTVHDCTFDIDMADEIDGQWQIKESPTPKTSTVINWDPVTMTYILSPPTIT